MLIVLFLQLLGIAYDCCHCCRRTLNCWDFHCSQVFLRSSPFTAKPAKNLVQLPPLLRVVPQLVGFPILAVIHAGLRRSSHHLRRSANNTILWSKDPSGSPTNTYSSITSSSTTIKADSRLIVPHRHDESCSSEGRTASIDVINVEVDGGIKRNSVISVPHSHACSSWRQARKDIKVTHPASPLISTKRRLPSTVCRLSCTVLHGWFVVILFEAVSFRISTLVASS